MVAIISKLDLPLISDLVQYGHFESQITFFIFQMG